MRYIFFACIIVFVIYCSKVRAKWSIEQAITWQKQSGYRAGSNFLPSTAENELQMFQLETYDPITIDRELQWAQDAGFTTMRVFLHNLLWQQGSEDFLNRVDDFLSIADKHSINIVLVLFDSCWDGFPKSGVQPDPIPGVHNSRWLQAPGYDIIHNTTAFRELQPYVQGVVKRFKDDSRVLAWDVWNEPDNSNYSGELIGPLLSMTFAWIREINPSQPLTTPVWWGFSGPFSPFQQLQLDLSDIISFHNYGDENNLQNCIKWLQAYDPGRPLICTEYMARTAGSHFEPNLQITKNENIFAINWGLVTGRSQTMYPWSNDAAHPATEEPEIWFHDIWRNTGVAFNQSEISYIQSVLKN